MEICLLKRKAQLYGNPPSFEVIEEFERAIESNGQANISIIRNDKVLLPEAYKLVFTRLGSSVNFPSIPNRNNKSIFSIQMGPDFGKVLPYSLRNKNVYGYFFDIWPRSFNSIEHFLTNSGIKHIFLSSQYTTRILNNKGFLNVSWIPEGVNLNEYKIIAYDRKDIDVLELGRKHQLIHEKIVDDLAKSGKKHLY